MGVVDNTLANFNRSLLLLVLVWLLCTHEQTTEDNKKLVLDVPTLRRMNSSIIIRNSRPQSTWPSPYLFQPPRMIIFAEAGRVRVKCSYARHLPDMDIWPVAGADGMCKITLKGKSYTSSSKDNTASPTWNFEKDFTGISTTNWKSERLTIEIIDSNAPLSPESMGSYWMNLPATLRQGVRQGYTKNLLNGKTQVKVTFSIVFVDFGYVPPTPVPPTPIPPTPSPPTPIPPTPIPPTPVPPTPIPPTPAPTPPPTTTVAMTESPLQGETQTKVQTLTHLETATASRGTQSTSVLKNTLSTIATRSATPTTTVIATESPSSSDASYSRTLTDTLVATQTDDTVTSSLNTRSQGTMSKGTLSRGTESQSSSQVTLTGTEPKNSSTLTDTIASSQSRSISVYNHSVTESSTITPAPTNTDTMHTGTITYPGTESQSVTITPAVTSTKEATITPGDDVYLSDWNTTISFRHLHNVTIWVPTTSRSYQGGDGPAEIYWLNIVGCTFNFLQFLPAVNDTEEFDWLKEQSSTDGGRTMHPSQYFINIEDSKFQRVAFHGSNPLDHSIHAAGKWSLHRSSITFSNVQFILDEENHEQVSYKLGLLESNALLFIDVNLNQSSCITVDRCRFNTSAYRGGILNQPSPSFSMIGVSSSYMYHSRISVSNSISEFKLFPGAFSAIPVTENGESAVDSQRSISNISNISSVSFFEVGSHVVMHNSELSLTNNTVHVDTIEPRDSCYEGNLPNDAASSESVGDVIDRDSSSSHFGSSESGDGQEGGEMQRTRCNDIRIASSFGVRFLGQFLNISGNDGGEIIQPDLSNYLKKYDQQWMKDSYAFVRSHSMLAIKENSFFLSGNASETVQHGLHIAPGMDAGAQADKVFYEVDGNNIEIEMKINVTRALRTSSVHPLEANPCSRGASSAIVVRVPNSTSTLSSLGLNVVMRGNQLRGNVSVFDHPSPSSIPLKLLPNFTCVVANVSTSIGSDRFILPFSNNQLSLSGDFNSAELFTLISEAENEGTGSLPTVTILTEWITLDTNDSTSALSMGEASSGELPCSDFSSDRRRTAYLLPNGTLVSSSPSSIQQVSTSPSQAINELVTTYDDFVSSLWYYCPRIPFTPSGSLSFGTDTITKQTRSLATPSLGTVSHSGGSVTPSVNTESQSPPTVSEQSQTSSYETESQRTGSQRTDSQDTLSRGTLSLSEPSNTSSVTSGPPTGSEVPTRTSTETATSSRWARSVTEQVSATPHREMSHSYKGLRNISGTLSFSLATNSERTSSKTNSATLEESQSKNTLSRLTFSKSVSNTLDPVNRTDLAGPPCEGGDSTPKGLHLVPTSRIYSVPHLTPSQDEIKAGYTFFITIPTSTPSYTWPDRNQESYDYAMQYIPSTESLVPNAKGFVTSAPISGLIRFNVSDHDYQRWQTQGGGFARVLKIELDPIPDFDILEDDVLKLFLPYQWFGATCTAARFEIAKLTVAAPPSPQLEAINDAMTVGTAVSMLAAGLAGASAAMDGQALAALSLMDCASPLEKKSLKNYRLLAPTKLHDSLVGVVAGNWILLFCFILLHVLVLCIIKKCKFRGRPWLEAQAFTRFPSLSITLTTVLFQGTGFAAMKLLVTFEYDSAEFKLVGFLGVITTTSIFLIYIWIARTKLEVTYCLYDWDFTYHNKDAWYVKLFPKGKWVPKEMKRSYGAYFASFAVKRQTIVWFPLILPVIMIVIGALKPHNLLGCTVQLSIMAVLCQILALTIIIGRPYRGIVSNVLAFCSMTCVALVILSSAITSSEPTSTVPPWLVKIFTPAQTVFSVARPIYSLAMMITELKIRGLELVPQFRWVPAAFCSRRSRLQAPTDKRLMLRSDAAYFSIVQKSSVGEAEKKGRKKGAMTLPGTSASNAAFIAEAATTQRFDLDPDDLDLDGEDHQLASPLMPNKEDEFEDQLVLQLEDDGSDDSDMLGRRPRSPSIPLQEPNYRPPTAARLASHDATTSHSSSTKRIRGAAEVPNSPPRRSPKVPPQQSEPPPVVDSRYKDVDDLELEDDDLAIEMAPVEPYNFNSPSTDVVSGEKGSDSSGETNNTVPHVHIKTSQAGGQQPSRPTFSGLLPQPADLEQGSNASNSAFPSPAGSFSFARGSQQLNTSASTARNPSSELATLGQLFLNSSNQSLGVRSVGSTRLSNSYQESAKPLNLSAPPSGASQAGGPLSSSTIILLDDDTDDDELPPPPQGSSLSRTHSPGMGSPQLSPQGTPRAEVQQEEEGKSTKQLKRKKPPKPRMLNKIVIPQELCGIPERGGWLWKRSLERTLLAKKFNMFGEWKIRYVHCTINGLSYYKEEPFKNAKNKLDWADVIAVARVVTKDIDPAACDPKYFYFGLHLNYSFEECKLLLFRCESAEERKRWVVHLDLMHKEYLRLAQVVQEHKSDFESMKKGNKEGTGADSEMNAEEDGEGLFSAME